ncbi:hypothetical protein HK100_007162, partial [Physocladia obscura]
IFQMVHITTYLSSGSLFAENFFVLLENAFLSLINAVHVKTEMTVTTILLRTCTTLHVFSESTSASKNWVKAILATAITLSQQISASGGSSAVYSPVCVAAMSSRIEFLWKCALMARLLCNLWVGFLRVYYGSMLFACMYEVGIYGVGEMKSILFQIFEPDVLEYDG